MPDDVCITAVRNLSTHVLSNERALNIIRSRFGVLDLREERGAWVLAVDSRFPGDFGSDDSLEPLMLTGLPLTALFANQKDPTPLGVHWDLAAQFFSAEQITAAYGDESEKKLSVHEAAVKLYTYEVPPEITKEAIANYDPAESIVCIICCMDVANLSNSSVRVVRTEYNEHGYVLALFCKYFMRLSESSVEEKDANYLIMLQCAALSASADNEDPSPNDISCLLLKQKTTQCSNCAADNASRRCTRCRLFTYCDEKCHAEHWELAHKHVCAAARSFSVAMSQLRSTSIDGDDLRKITQKAQAIYNAPRGGAEEKS